MSKMKKIAAMTAALLISASTMGYLPQDSIKISNVTANAAEEEITSVEINETNFPDAIFREYVKSSFDTDGDGVLSAEEIADITSLYLFGSGIYDLTGIEYFKNLEYLNCWENNLTYLDVSKNTALKSLECDDNQLTSLDVSNNPALKLLGCSKNHLTSLDLSNNTALTELYCNENQLTSLDVSNNTALEYLNCKFNQLTSLDTSKNTALKLLHCETNQLSSLDVSNNTELLALYCNENQITTLNVSKNTMLNRLECIKNQLTTIDTSNNTNLQTLMCDENQITTLDISNNALLNYLRCNQNQLKTIDISKNEELDFLKCNNNQLTSIDTHGRSLSLEIFDNAYEIVLTDNTFDLSTLPEGFDVTKAANWTNAEVEGNILTVIDDAKYVTYDYDCGKGITLSFALFTKNNTDNQVSEILDVKINQENFPDKAFRQYITETYDDDQNGTLSYSEAMGASTMHISESGISDLTGLQYFKNLQILDCPDNELTQLNISENKALTHLYCANNNLTALDTSNNPFLYVLFCHHNNITNLDVTNNTKLAALWCSDNQLTTLDVTKNTALEDLGCDNNQLTSLDLSNNKVLTGDEIVFDTSDNKYEISVIGNTFDLSTLPAGFDVSKASEWTNGTVDGNILTVDDTSKEVTYKYNCGNKIAKKFTLIPQIAEPPGETTTAPKTTTTATTTKTAPKATTTTTTAKEEITGLEINETNFPDPIFRQYVAEEFDLNCNSELSDKEIAYVTEIYIDESGISDLTGIEYFENLAILYCSFNNLTTLDLSDCTALKNLSCGHNQLTSLDISNCTALNKLSCEYNQLTSLDVSNCSALTNLSCYDNQLTSLDVSNCSALTNLSCDDNQITSLDVSNNSALSFLQCRYNKLTSLDVSNNPELRFFTCYGNQLTSLDVSKNTALTNLGCHNNQLTSLDVSNNTALEFLNCSDNQLASLDVSNNTALTDLYTYRNEYEITLTGKTFDLSTLPAGFDVTKASDWTNGTVKGNILTVWDASKNIIYKYDLGNGNSETFILIPQVSEEITSVEINAENFPDKIFRNYVKENFDTDGDGVLSAEEIANVTELNIDACGINNLAGLEYFENLKLLSCADNNITELDLSQNKELEELYCSVNFSIESINVSNNKALKVLHCTFNKLTSLDLSNNTALEQLYCTKNKLSTLDLSKNTELIQLLCSENQLTSLDLSNNPALTSFSCDDNKYKIALTNNTFDLSTLPGGFDISKASEWTNATVKGNILTVDDTSKEVTYKYGCGNKIAKKFTLIPQVAETPVETTTAPKTTATTTTTTATAMFTTTTFAPPSYSCSLSVYPYDEADTIYEIGEELDYSTIRVQGHGTMTSFGSTSYIDIHYTSLDKCSSVTVDASEFDNTKPGTYTIYVEWYNAKDSFEVTVIDPDNPTAIPGVEINETNFPDPVFRQYLAKNFDKNTDGRLSDKEIADVTGLYLGELGISDLTGIQHFENLQILSCRENNLTQLDISENKALTHLYCENNNLTTLDTSNNVLLFALDCHNNKLTKLDFSNNPELEGVWCSNNQLTSLDVSHNTLLSDLACSNNQLASIDLSNTICIEIAEWGLLLYGNKHKITITDNTFDLSTLPTNFDVTKASDWTNATVKGNILTIEDITKEVTYTYDCGLGFSDTFALVPQIEETPAETTTTTAAPETTITTTAAPETTITTTTTTAPVTTTPATTTPEDDLPQTGFSKLYNCIPVSAGALVLLGMYAVKKSKKEDEE